MRTAIAQVLLLSSIALAEEPKQSDAVKAELKKLEGVWEGYAVEGKGEKPNQGPVHLRITITGDKMTAVDLANNNKDMGSGTFKLDPSKPVKEIDATGVVLPGKKDRTFEGIYELDGDTLKWCVDNRRNARPTEFRTINGNYLLILKRK
jgi:uncharacterized protein (TIGR03067 family)